MHSGVYTLAELQPAIAADPGRWQPLVFTNGCFDILYAGYVRYLQADKASEKSLVIGVNQLTK
jgi:D-glycero-beta-D-manno-heptose 1-phosphate adenylyltransferase